MNARQLNFWARRIMAGPPPGWTPEPLPIQSSEPSAVGREIVQASQGPGDHHHEAVDRGGGARESGPARGTEPHRGPTKDRVEAPRSQRPGGKAHVPSAGLPLFTSSRAP